MIEHTASDDGRRHSFRGRTKKGFEQFKKDVNLELNSTWASPLVSFSWQGHTALVKSPGASGIIRLDDGIVTTELTLDGWPATLPWLRERIVHDIRGMTEAIVESSVLEQLEHEARARIQSAALDRLKRCRDREVEASQSLRRWQVFDDSTRVLVAVTGAGSAFALWAQNLSEPLRPLALSLVSTAAALSTLQAALRVSDQIKSWADLQGHFVRLRNDLETFIEQMAFRTDFPIGEFQGRLETYERRFGDGEVLWRTDLLSTLAFWGRTRRQTVDSSGSGH